MSLSLAGDVTNTSLNQSESSLLNMDEVPANISKAFRVMGYSFKEYFFIVTNPPEV